MDLEGTWEHALLLFERWQSLCWTLTNVMGSGPGSIINRTSLIYYRLKTNQDKLLMAFVLLSLALFPTGVITNNDRSWSGVF